MDDLMPMLKRIDAYWRKQEARYKRAGSDWHDRMPGDWPANGLVLTIDDVRIAVKFARLSAPVAAEK